MKKDRSELEKYLLKQCERIALYPDKCEAIRKNLLETFDIPTGMTMDMIARGKLAEQTEHILFCLLKGIENFTSDKNAIEEFFTSIEIEKYKNTKMPKKQLKFPIVIKCNQVAVDQWIGATDTNWFMPLREAQLINYNENAQRTLTKTIINGEESYKITVVEKTVKGIMNRLKRGEYIPTPITLNIPLEVNSDFYFDEEERALIINSLPYFDIADGYHRYVAMCRLKDADPNFNCNWELRIACFTEAKARDFVYQESLKTPMKKMDAQAMNMYNASSRAATMLNQDTLFNLFGQINNMGGKIPASEFIKVLDTFYFKGKTETDENALVRYAKNDVRNKLNYLIDADETYLTKKYTYVDLLIMLYVFSKVEDLSYLDMYIKGIAERVNKIHPTKLHPSKNITKSLVNDLDEIFKEVK